MTSFIQDLKEKRNDQIKKRIHTTIPNFFKRKKKSFLLKLCLHLAQSYSKSLQYQCRQEIDLYQCGFPLDENTLRQNHKKNQEIFVVFEITFQDMRNKYSTYKDNQKNIHILS